MQSAAAALCSCNKMNCLPASPVSLLFAFRKLLFHPRIELVENGNSFDVKYYWPFWSDSEEKRTFCHQMHYGSSKRKQKGLKNTPRFNGEKVQHFIEWGWSGSSSPRGCKQLYKTGTRRGQVINFIVLFTNLPKLENESLYWSFLYHYFIKLSVPLDCRNPSCLLDFVL